MNSNTVFSKNRPRIRHSCLECTKRKVRCNKVIPCQRCQRLGIEESCRREQPPGLASKPHPDPDPDPDSDVGVEKASELRILCDLHEQLSTSGREVSAEDIVQSLRDRITLLSTSKKGIIERASDGAYPEPRHARKEGQEGQNSISMREKGNEIPHPLQSSLPGPESEGPWEPPHDSRHSDEDSHSATALEYLAWGRTYRRFYNDTSSPSKGKTPFAPSSDLLPRSLPKHNEARTLVEFHIKHVSWHHNSIHGPTFLDQCELFWESGLINDGAWLALYLSVLAVAAWHSPVSNEVEASLKSKAHVWYNDMINTLYRIEFLRVHSIHAVQAVAISTMVAHVLGQTNVHTILLTSSIRIAQCLGLHKPNFGTENLPKNSFRWWENIVRIQTGRRVWWQLVTQDYFSIPFTDSYVINPNHVDVELPLNCDDHDMIGRSHTEPTISSYSIVLAKMASLMPKVLDGIHCPRDPIPLNLQYQHILMMDLKLRETVSSFPPFLMRRTPEDSSWPAWVFGARRALTISAADKLIMIHRSFLIRSLRSPLYAHTRMTCLSASLTILREFIAINSSDIAALWTVSAFTLGAAIIVLLDLLHKPSLGDSANQELVENVIHGLRGSAHNKMAVKGACLVSNLLNEVQRQNSRYQVPHGYREWRHTGDISIEMVTERFVSEHQGMNELQEISEPHVSGGMQRKMTMQQSGGSNQYVQRDQSNDDLEGWFEQAGPWFSDMGQELTIGSESLLNFYGQDMNE